MRWKLSLRRDRCEGLKYRRVTQVEGLGMGDAIVEKNLYGNGNRSATLYLKLRFLPYGISQRLGL